MDDRRLVAIPPFCLYTGAEGESRRTVTRKSGAPEGSLIMHRFVDTLDTAVMDCFPYGTVSRFGRWFVVTGARQSDVEAFGRRAVRTFNQPIRAFVVGFGDLW